MPGLSDLPAELHHLIGLHVFDPSAITPRDRLSGYGCFNRLDGYRKTHLYSLMAYASTSKAIRHALEPVAFWSVTLRSMECVRGALRNHWGQSVKTLRLRLDEFEHEDDLDWIWEAADGIASLLNSLSGLQHLYLSVTARQAAVLALVISKLVPASPPAPPVAGDREPLSKRIVSFGLDCDKERNNTKPIFTAVEPLMATFSNLDFLLVKCYNEVERTRSRPRILPFLSHVNAPLRIFNISGCWQERDDDLLSLLPKCFWKLQELFILHGCDHINHGQWKDNAVSRLETFQNIQLIVWEVETFWQAIEAQLDPFKEENITRQLAVTLPSLEFVGFSRFNMYDHLFGINRRPDPEIDGNGEADWLMPVDHSSTGHKAFITSPTVFKASLI